MNFKEVLIFAVGVAATNGYRLNPDDDRLSRVITGLMKNKEKYGFLYCPCRVPTGDIHEDVKIVCPCESSQDDITVRGKCRCSLFFSHTD